MQNKYWFKSTKDFYKFIKSEIPKFDNNKSQFAPWFSFYDVDGKFYNCKNFLYMLRELNKMKGEEFFATSSSRANGIPHYFVQTGQSELAESLSEVIKRDIPEEVEEVVETEALISLEAVDEPKVKEPDWKWIESLEDTKENRKLLDDYAEKEFGIKLRKNMLVANMTKKFKEALEA